MRKLIVLLAVFLFGACSALPVAQPDFVSTNKADTYSYQGPIDPKEFASWDEVQSVPVPTMVGLIYDVYLKNPDDSASIQFANIITLQGNLVGYYLIHEGSFYAYKYMAESNCFSKDEIEPDLLIRLKADFKEHFGVECN